MAIITKGNTNTILESALSPANATHESNQGTCVAETVETLTAHFSEVWQACPTSFPGRPPINTRAKRKNEAAVTNSLSELIKRIDDLPSSAEARTTWRNEFRGAMRNSTLESAPFHRSQCWRHLLSDEAIDVTEAFLKKGRAFNPEFATEDFYQALRNVWIMNCIQIFRGQPVSYSRAVFAYSMLYPYTDNLLDDQIISRSEKARFGLRLRQRLKGAGVKPQTDHETDVFRLISMIESDFPRYKFPGVYDSLLAIHDAQTKSLDMQSPIHNQANMTKQTVEKGGTSVLADAYLLDGKLNPEEAVFQFGFGVLLQLLDDAQDIEEDLAAGHQTLFTTSAESGQKLDLLCNQLFGFVNAVISLADCFPQGGQQAACELIGENCTFMIMTTVAEYPELFSEAYLKKLESISPVGFEFLRMQKPFLSGHFQRIESQFANEGGLLGVLS